MAVENNIELIIHVDSDKILFEYTKTNGPGKKYAPDEYNEDTIRIELQVAKTFHKVLNYLYLKKDIFQRKILKSSAKCSGRFCMANWAKR